MGEPSAARAHAGATACTASAGGSNCASNADAANESDESNAAARATNAAGGSTGAVNAVNANVANERGESNATARATNAAGGCTGAVADTAVAGSNGTARTSSSSAAYCPQCELRALQAALTPERIRAQAAQMAAKAGVTAPAAEYERRLAVCGACPRLQGGVLCAECGSYVAYRARLLAATCPYPGKNKWA